jgi:hypothetical protein
MESVIGKLLVVSWTMPPLLLPRSIQVGRSLKGLNQLGWDATVLRVNPASVRNVKLDSALEEKYSGYYRSFAVDSDESSWKWRIIRKMFFMFDQSPYIQRTWMKGAIQKAQSLLEAEKFSAIISFAQPWSDHLIGRELHRISGLPWVAHFSDPWAENPFIGFKRFQGSFLRRMEEAVVREANAVIFVSSRTADLAMSKYPQSWRAKAHVIPHSYEMLEQTDNQPVQEKRKLRLRYIGNFYGPRTPGNFLRALSTLNQRESLADQLEVSFFGKELDRFQPLVRSLGLEGIATLHGHVSLEESHQLSREADVLLVIDAPNETESLFLPSKLVDYLAFKKTIFGITPLNGASADLIRGLNCPVAAPDDILQIVSVVKTLLDQWKRGVLSISPEFEQAISKYELHQTAKALDEILHNVISK